MIPWASLQESDSSHQPRRPIESGSTKLSGRLKLRQKLCDMLAGLLVQPVPKLQPVTMPLVNSSCDGVVTPIVVWLQLNFELLERQSTGKRQFVVLVV